ncbi:MAG: iron-containing alcohol dehydrogenase [Chloroflexi bacterium]|nr:iron-containing alcohol dehydrogenase [Chloroflexota bacterium]
MAVRKLFIPKDVFYGWGAVEALRNWPGKRAFIVTDRTMVRQGHVEKVEKLLREAGYQSDVYSDVEPEPSRETIQGGARRGVEFRPDVIVGLGGGSCIDAGKVVRLFYEHPQLMGLSWTELGQQARQVKLGHKASYVAIPTTSGTGSEATPVAILSNQESSPPVKVRVLNMGNLPDMAICDAQFPFTMPPHVTADTGFDALVHAIECFIVNRPTEIVDALAIKAFQTVYRWLPRAVHDGQDREARERVHTAATMAGIAACNGSTGLVHDMAHQIGGAFHIAHGRSNALAFDAALSYYLPKAGAKFLEAAEAIGLRPKDEADGAVRLLGALRELRREIGIPLTMNEAGISEKEYMDLIEVMATNARTLALRPSQASHDEMRSLFLKAWSGAPL